ncbi:MAG: tRNA preQ1(34) S-adenosylmethionine ribosyltransferase-isomerase QueA [Patescibacteria group bacterium]
MKLSQFNYNLPKNLIAQKPAKPRESSRLMVLDRKKKTIRHDHFYNLPKYLNKGDVLVFNDSKVFPARLPAKKSTGGKLEVFLLRPEGKYWQCLVGGKVRREGMEFVLGHKDTKTRRHEELLRGEIVKKLGEGIWLVKFNKSGNHFWKIVNKYGQAPTPPYIKRASNLKEYQTVFAKNLGSVAAPTAGFHFSRELIKKLRNSGIETEFVTLHVGYGTFQPVKVDDVKKHKMHAEFLEVKKEVIDRLLKYKKEGRRIIAVGTTSTRAMEAVFNKYTRSRRIPIRRTKGAGMGIPAYAKKDFYGWVSSFIYPGYQFKFIDSLITNFHLPKSTLFMLVSAFAGLPFTKKAYQTAIRKKYRFYSFGDGMLII